MPAIAPIAPLRYNPTKIRDLGAVIAPPYDVISEERRRELLQRDPHNFIRLILPEGDGDERYAHAAELFDAWQRDQVLVREEEPALYLYTQTFKHPVTNQRVVRHGFVGGVALSPFSEGKVLPHERTLSGPKADRLKLMEATRANLEPIFGVYRDPTGASARRLEQIVARETTMIDATDPDGVQHRVWKLSASDAEAFQSDLATNTVFIVDGHHRYETALNYRSAHAGDDKLDSILMFLAPMADPGLIILPTHRVVHSLTDANVSTVFERMQEHFEMVSAATSEEGLAMLQQRTTRPSFLLIGGGRTVVASLKDNVDPSALLDPTLPRDLAELDVTILHEFIIERLLGVTKEAQASQTNLRYVKSADEAYAEARKPDVQLVILMNATRLDQVERVAESGQVMPQKSTFFYPKLASGLLVNPLW